MLSGRDPRGDRMKLLSIAVPLTAEAHAKTMGVQVSDAGKHVVQVDTAGSFKGEARVYIGRIVVAGRNVEGAADLRGATITSATLRLRGVDTLDRLDLDE